jgi:prevent-host-death family protein
MERINVAEAKSRFSELISRAAAGERFIIQRRERPVAALIGAAELERVTADEEGDYSRLTSTNHCS